MVNNGSLNGQQSIELNGLESGIYNLSIQQNGTTNSTMFVKQ
jgi:hypothetical protein